jgi:polyvinyl alcohol dehydrogenase (cytochrome)
MGAVVALGSLLGAAGLVPVAAGAAAPGCQSADWAAYGQNANLTFAVPAGCSPIGKRNVATLVPKWFFHAKDSITASPAVSGDTVYVGAWDGTFYALDADTGRPRWTYVITTTNPTAFGKIPSSANVVSFPDAATGKQRRVVLFGGGSSLWALDATTGRLLATIDLDPRTAALRAKQSSDPPVVEVESSPVVADVKVGRLRKRLIYVGMDVHNHAGVGPAGVVGLELRSGRDGRWAFNALWRHDPETDRVYKGAGALTAGSGKGQGCGDVWSSPAVDVATNEVVFGVANCDHVTQARAAGQHWSEAMVAVRADTGALVWRFAPAATLPTRADQDAAANADVDFGASPNIFTLPSGRRVVGEGQKSADYWARDLRTGAPVWHSLAGAAGNVSDGFAVGGFIGSTAVESGTNGRARRVVGTTAIPVPHTATELRRSTWAVRGLDAQTGQLSWTYKLGGPSYAATSIVNSVAFVPETVPSALLALDTDTGAPLWAAPVLGPPASTAVVAGDSVYLGTGTRETDLEYKAVGLSLQKGFVDAIGESPLSPLSGVQAFRLATR